MSKQIFRTFLSRLGSKFAFSADKRMFCKQFLEYQKSAPDMADSVWDMLNRNYALRKKYGSQFKIVSLGWSCLPRTLATFTMLKAGKKAGEKSMPCDLALTPPAALAQFLRSDFQNYISGKSFFDTKNGYWISDTEEGGSFVHDKDCGADDYRKLADRYHARINNFREALNFPGTVLFLMHKATHVLYQEVNHSVNDFEAVFREIKRIRGDKPFKILLFSCDHNDTTSDVNGAELIRLPWPDAKYIWHHKERHTPEGVRFEMAFAEYCRNALLSMLKENEILKS